MVLEQELNFFCKRPDGKYSGFVSHVVSIATPQLCPYSMRTGIYNMQMNEYDCFLIKCYYKNLAHGP